MSSELERRLEGVLTEAGEPDPGAGEEALHRALRALHPVAAPRRGIRTAVLVFAAALVLLVIAAGSLAAAGALHVSFGKQPKARSATSALKLPRSTAGVLAVVYGRLSVTTKTGFHLQGLPVTAAALSPHALYVVAGIGDSLVAMAPNGRRAWTHPVGARGCAALERSCGSVAAMAWAPDGLRIAYVVRTNTRRLVLHVIWGNGTHDTVIDRSARGVTPSWRADSLAFAYVGGGGRPIVYDVAHQSRRVIRWPSVRQATHLAFAPSGGDLAIQTETAAMLVGRRHEVLWRGQPRGLDWLGTRLVVAQRPNSLTDQSLARFYSVGRSGATLTRSEQLPGPLVATHGRTLAVVSHENVLAGRLGALRSVLEFRLKSCDPEGGCEIPIASNAVQIG